MTPDGISTDDWGRVHEAVVEVVSASSIEDDALCSHHIERLFDLLSKLEARYGRIPGILATRADFTDDPETAIALHEEALSVASDPTSTRLSLQSLVRLMIGGRYPESQVLDRLKALEDVTNTDGDSSDLEELRELEAAFERTKAKQGAADQLPTC